MQTQAKQPDTDCQDSQFNEELADVLTAISVVSKRLARKITVLAKQENLSAKGGKSNGENE